MNEAGTYCTVYTIFPPHHCCPSACRSVFMQTVVCHPHRWLIWTPLSSLWAEEACVPVSPWQPRALTQTSRSLQQSQVSLTLTIIFSFSRHELNMSMNMNDAGTVLTPSPPVFRALPNCVLQRLQTTLADRSAAVSCAPTPRRH